MTAKTNAGTARLSSVCAKACLGLATLVPVAVVGFWAFGSWEALALVRLLPPDVLHEMPAQVQVWQRVVGAAICLVPALLTSWSLMRARRSLLAFAGGDYFAGDAVRGLRDYARIGFWAAVAGILSVPVLSVAVSFANAPGHRELSLDLSGAQVLNLLGAGILWVIASAMARASLIAAENEQFV